MVLDSTEEERRVMRECTKDAFWYRALPSAAVAGTSLYCAVRAGKFKSIGSSRFRTWSVIAGFSSFAYIVAKLSYVLGENCKQKFLVQAPNSDISNHIRKKRSIPNSRIEEFQDREESIQERREAIQERREAIQERKEAVYELFDIVDSKDFDESKMTEKEQQILIDCNSVAFYQYSLPAMVGASVTTYAGVARSSKMKTRSLMAQSAPVALACTLGYFIGQVLYMYSTDCSDRFIKYAPEGEIAKKLQQHYSQPQEFGELCEGCQVVAVLENDRDEYVIPVSDDQSVKNLVNSAPVSTTHNKQTSSSS